MFPNERLMRAFRALKTMVDNIIELSDVEMWIDSHEKAGMDSNLIMHLAATEGRTDVVKFMARQGHPVNFFTSGDSVTPLHQACLQGHIETVQALIQAGALVNLRNYDGCTPLCLACTRGDLEIVKLLIAHNAEVKPTLNLITTPLHEAVIGDNYEIIELLLDHGADTEVSDLHFGTSLHVAAYKNNSQSAVILLKRGADVNASKTLTTALHLAATNNNIQMAAVLLEFGANVWRENNWSRRAKDITSKKSKLYTLLSEFEAEPITLKYQCRFYIRRHLCQLQVRRLERIDDLGLPKYLTWFLKHGNFALNKL